MAVPVVFVAIVVPEEFLNNNTKLYVSLLLGPFSSRLMLITPLKEFADVIKLLTFTDWETVLLTYVKYNTPFKTAIRFDEVNDHVPNPPLAVHPVVPELKSELVNNCIGVGNADGIILNPFENVIATTYDSFIYP